LLFQILLLLSRLVLEACLGLHAGLEHCTELLRLSSCFLLNLKHFLLKSFLPVAPSPETNTAPENNPLQKGYSLWKASFSGAMTISGNVNSSKKVPE